MDILFHSRSIHPENSENRAFYRNPKLDAILDSARAEVDREVRLGLYAEANAILAEDAPWAFLYYPVDMVAWQPYVKGFRPHPVWANEYRNVWLDLPRQRVAQSIYAEEATP
jgi:peptide/nickel transport system substrate-binding protein